MSDEAEVFDQIKVPGYTVHKVLGRGGMASVYLATQQSLHRKVALKILDDVRDDKFYRRFVNEGRFIASLRNPHIITIYDIAELADGRCYIAMEYVDGGDLLDKMEEALPPKFALKVARQVVEALATVHAKGIIHRDIKPANILFRTDGTALITDFGIAKSLDTNMELTRKGSAIGSPAYISPEQSIGSHVDFRTDFYSLGVVFFEMLTGTNPYRGKGYADTIRNHLEAPTPKFSRSLRKYQPLIDRLLAKPPEDRFGSAEELMAELDHFLEPFTEAPPGGSDKKEAGISFNPKTALAAIGITIIFSVAGYSWWSSSARQNKTAASYLAEAEAHLQSGHLYAPKQDNAGFFYLKALEADPDNKLAKAGVQQVVALLLQLGEQRLRENKLTKPEEDSAAYYFRRALAFDGANSIALKELGKIVDHHIALAKATYDAGNIEDANLIIDRALIIDPENDTAKRLREILALPDSHPNPFGGWQPNND